MQGWVEEINKKPPLLASKDEVLARMVQTYGDKLIMPDQFPKMFEHQFRLTAYEIFLEKNQRKG